MNISAIILAKNAQSTISQCLSSLFWCDEILVIDDNSVDKTAAIARKIGARVLKRPLNGDFATQRNFGLRHALNEWVLFVDVDEVVSQKLAQEIQKRVGHEGYTAYSLKRIDFFYKRFLRFGETGHIRLVRLGKKGAGLWNRPVHEKWHVIGQIGNIFQPLYHYPHKNLHKFLEKIDAYTSLNAAYLYQRGEKSRGVDIMLYPLAKFVKNYIIYLGFLDSMPGFIHAVVMSFHSFLTRAKLYLINKS